MSDNRDVGVEFGPLADELAGAEYPLSSESLIELYGDHEVSYANGRATLADLVGGSGPDRFEGPEEVHQVVLNMVGVGAVGRPRYSDRPPRSTNEEGLDQSL
jgi:hypothetical protein